MQKIVKRMKGFISERDITITQDTMEKVLGKNHKAVVIEEGLDFLKKLLNEKDIEENLINNHKKIDKITDDGRIIYKKDLLTDLDFQQLAIKDVDVNTLFEISYGNSLKQLEELGLTVGPGYDTKLTSKEFIDKFFTRDKIGKILTSFKTNAELEAEIKTMFDNKVITEGERKILEDFMHTAELEIDGIAALNQSLFFHKKQGILAQLNEQIKILKDRIDAPGASKDLLQQNKDMQRLAELLERRTIISQAENLYQITGRGAYDESGLKIAFNVTEFDRNFSHAPMIIGRSGLKKEIGLAGQINFITVSGLGGPSSGVYADPVSLAFHPEIFNTAEELQAIEQYSGQLLYDYQQAIESNVLPSKVRKMLHKNLVEDLSYADPSLRQAKIRNQQYARELLAMHTSGIGPKDSPAMANLLLNFYQTEAFRMVNRDEVTRFLPTMPNAWRFALSTETADAALRPGAAEHLNLVKE